MKLTLIALVLLSGLACELVASRSHSNSLAWRQFKQQYGKVYATQEEEARRFAIFMSNKQLIDQHNADASASFTMALSRMSDQTPEEYESMNRSPTLDGAPDVISAEELHQILGSAQDDPLPDEFDWRKQEGRVSPVGSQGDCAADWAFAATGLLEGQELSHNMSSFVPLSQQQLLDCQFLSQGCAEGFPWPALDHLAYEKKSLESGQDYPYEGDVGKCRADPTKFVPLRIKGEKRLPFNDEQTLKKTVVNYGPVAVTFKASWNFLHYGGGFFEDSRCYTTEKNHSALVVGYGKDPQKGEYWIIKNSWGTGWGEQGYIRFKAGTNMCSISDFSTIAIF